MKTNFKFLTLFALLLLPALIFAQSEVQPIDFSDPSSLITWLMPLITLGVTWIIKKVSPLITGTTTLIAVPLISSGIAYLGTLTSDSSNWVVMFLAGLVSVFLNQLYRGITKD